MLVGVYNCEHEVEILNDWKDWASIIVDPPNVDEQDDDLHAVSCYLLDIICLFLRFWLLMKLKINQTKHQQLRLRLLHDILCTIASYVLNVHFVLTVHFVFVGGTILQGHQAFSITSIFEQYSLKSLVNFGSVTSPRSSKNLYTVKYSILSPAPAAASKKRVGGTDCNTFL
jgi:hypothetical protein